MNNKAHPAAKTGTDTMTEKNDTDGQTRSGAANCSALVVSLSGPLIEQGGENAISWKHEVEKLLDGLEKCGLERTGSGNGQTIDIRFRQGAAFGTLSD